MTKKRIFLIVAIVIILIPIIIFSISKFSNTNNDNKSTVPTGTSHDIISTQPVNTDTLTSTQDVITSTVSTTISSVTSESVNNSTTSDEAQASTTKVTTLSDSPSDKGTTTGKTITTTKGTTTGSKKTTTTTKNNNSNPPTNVDDKQTAMDFVKKLKLGWNLGNTLDSTDAEGNRWLKGKTPKEYESAWGNPVTTKKMIDTVKSAGFNVIRIPVTWDQHIGNDSSYTIDKKWLDRVQEVVDYAIDSKTYVILNMHHEEWLYTSNSNYQKVNDKFKKVWTQIANRFSSYGENLIFEGMNEVRLYGQSNEWSGNIEAYQVVNKLNNDFVNTIRKSGGNNKTRFLMVPTYAASADQSVLNHFIVPDDSRVIVSLHAYTPYKFALNNDSSTLWYSETWSKSKKDDTNEIDSLMTRIQKEFISKNIPVVLGEFGALNKNNTSSRVEWAKYYVSSATKIGVPCVWWDNGAFQGKGENFGLLNRSKSTWAYLEIVKALVDSSK